MPSLRLTVPLVLAAAGWALAGCGPTPAAAPRSVLVVQFTPAAAEDQALHAQVRRACSGIAGVHVVPPRPSTVPEYNVIFDVTDASPLQVSRLYGCLSHQPDVVAAEPEGGLGFG